MPVGKKAEVADAREAGRQGMNEETADELVGGKLHHAGLVFIFVAIIFPLKGNLAVAHAEDSFVGEGDAMRVTAQVFQGLAWSAEWWFGIHDPFAALLRNKAGGKGDGIPQGFGFTEETELSLIESILQRLKEQAAEQA